MEGCELLSERPWLFKCRNFLAKEECEHLIELAEPYLERSRVSNGTKQGLEDGSRTSWETSLRRGKDNIVEAIEKRIADRTSMPIEHGDDMEIIRYKTGQKFDLHYDFIPDGRHNATFLMFLSDVEKGGETVFPKAQVKKSNSLPWYKSLLFRQGGISVKPQKGDALFFWNTSPDGTPDYSSLQGACPVIKGTKWSAIKSMNTYNLED